jgi:hypothetical protein
VHSGPGAAGPPGPGDFSQSAAGPVSFGDLGVQPGFVPGQAAGCIGTPRHYQPGGERPQSLNLLHALDGLTGVERPQRRAIQQPAQGSLGDRPQILAPAARKTPVEPKPGTWARGTRRPWPWRAINSAPSRAAWPIRSRRDNTVGQPPPMANGNHPGLAQASRLGAGNHRVPAARLRPAPRVNAGRQQPARPRRGRLQVTLTADPQPRGGPGLGGLRFGAAPVLPGANTVRSPGPAGRPASTAGVKPSQNRRLASSDHGPQTSNPATYSAIACSAPSPIPAR